MSKSVLVIDTPESCAQCPLLNGSDECVMQDASANFNADSFDDLMHGCPLKSLPEEKEEEDWRSKLSLAWIRGWNTCISKITGGEVDGEINGRFRNR